MLGGAIKKQLKKMTKEQLIQIIEDAFNINQDLTERVNIVIDILRGEIEVQGAKKEVLK